MTFPACAQLRINIGGNYIQHYPDVPDLIVRSPLRHPRATSDGVFQYGAPAVLRYAERSILEWYSRPSKLPQLNHVAYQDRSELDKRRQMSSAGREACVKVARVLLSYCDLATMRVGRYSHVGFVPLSVSRIAYEARISKRRCERVLARFYRTKWLSSSRRYSENEFGEYRGEIAVRHISEAFFYSLGVGREHLNKARRRASERVQNFAYKSNKAIQELLQAHTANAFDKNRQLRLKKEKRKRQGAVNKKHLNTFDKERVKAGAAALVANGQFATHEEAKVWLEAVYLRSNTSDS